MKQSNTFISRRLFIPTTTALAGIALTVASPHARAEVRFWNPATGDFNDGANWTNPFTAPWPDNVDTAAISNGGTATFSSGTVNLVELWPGQNTASTPSTGTYTQTGGTVNLSNGLVVGRQGSAIGNFNLSGGATLSTRNFRLGGGTATAQGTAVVSGTGTTLATGVGAIAAIVGIGAPGIGNLTVQDGATWNAINTNVFVGGDNFAAGTTGPNLGGTGTLNVTGGASFNLTNINLAIGRNGNGNGTLNVTDGGKLILTRSAGDPILNLANVNGTSTIPAGAANPVAALTLSGDQSVIEVPRVLIGLGTATFNLNGGTFAAGRFNKGTGTATIHFNGTTVKATVDQADYFGGFTSAGLDITTGGLIFDNGNFFASITQGMTGTGGLTKKGAGMLVLSAVQSYTGDTVVQEGILQLITPESLNDSAALRLTSNSILVTPTLVDVTPVETVNAFYIDGVQQEAGTWGAIGSDVQHESELISGDGVLQVTTGPGAPGGSPFTTWATTTKGLSGNDALATADPDHDGYNNLAEFILGGEPNPATAGSNADAIAPTLATGTGNHVFSFRRTQLATTQAGLTIGYEYGSALTGWTPAVDGTGGVTIVPTPDGYGTGIDRVDVTIPDTLAVDGKVFVRLKGVLAAP